MSAAFDLLQRVRDAGGVVKSEGNRLELRAPQPLPSDLMDDLRQHKAELLAALRLDQLRVLAGDDWAVLQSSPVLLAAFSAAIETRRMREQGEIPPHYTATTVCARCGPVHIFPGCGPSVEGCPWCLNRVAGSPIPTPNTAHHYSCG